MIRLAVALLLISALFLTAVQANAACPPETPESILDCLEKAYAERDIELYASLLAEDFVFAHSDTKASWDREGDLAGTRRLFENEHVASLSMEIGFEEKGEVRDGGEPGLFVLDGVWSRIEITDIQEKAPRDFTVTAEHMTLWVRSDAGGGPFQIVRWLSPMDD